MAMGQRKKMKIFSLSGSKGKEFSGRNDWLKNICLTDRSPFAIAEAFNSLRTNVIFSIPGKECKKILVTSAMAGEQKSSVSINLALALAKSGFKVLLIDCDLRRPSVASKLLLNKNSLGISELLVNKAEIKDVLTHWKDRIWVISSGTIPPNPTELLGSDRMEEIVDKLTHYFDYIIFDTPPIGQVTDAVVLSRLVSGVIFVCRSGAATRESTTASLSQLEFVNAKILGFVFTGVNLRDEKRYGKRGYGYGYLREDRKQ